MFASWFPDDDSAPHSCGNRTHAALDRARVEYLFQLYEQLTAPLALNAKARTKRLRKI